MNEVARGGDQERMMTTHETRYLQTFDRYFSPAQAALREICGQSLTARQLHAAERLLHALADEAASAQVSRPRR